MSWKIKMIAGCITGCFFLCACENSAKEIKDFDSKGLKVEEAKNVNLIYTLGGHAKSKLLSPLMLRVQDTVSYVEFPKTLHVDFYNDSAQVESRLDAHYGKYFDNQQQNRVFLKDSVRLINIAGDTLYCQELWWDRNRIGDEFHTDKAVRIRTKMQIIDGIGMDASQDFKHKHVIQVTGIVNVPNSQFPTN